MKQNKLNEIIGWIGMVFILLAYILLSFELLNSNDWFFQALNAVGAFGIVYISFKKKAYQPGVLNVIWGIVALISIIKLFL